MCVHDGYPLIRSPTSLSPFSTTIIIIIISGSGCIIDELFGVIDLESGEGQRLVSMECSSITIHNLLFSSLDQDQNKKSLHRKREREKQTGTGLLRLMNFTFVCC